MSTGKMVNTRTRNQPGWEQMVLPRLERLQERGAIVVVDNQVIRVDKRHVPLYNPSEPGGPEGGPA